MARPVLFLSSNGIGLGHLSRQLAIASRLPPHLRAVFYSQSSGIRLAREAGFAALHTQHHRYNGLGVTDWNRHLGKDLTALAQHLPFAAIIADCTVVFGGFARLLDASAGHVPRIWIRRGFLGPEHARHMTGARFFDHIIEPEDLAAELDHGPTAALRHQVVSVPPVLYVAPDERLPRDEARAALGLTGPAPVVALLLGNTLGRRTAAIRRTLIGELGALGAEVVDIRSQLAVDAPEPAPEAAPEATFVRRVSLYPAFAQSRAFDAVITLAGYNAFHEAMLGAVPTLFLVWPQSEMDRQDLRVAWAEARGLALGMRAEPLAAGDGSGVAAKVASLLSASVAGALARLPSRPNGAHAAAALIARWTA